MDEPKPYWQGRFLNQLQGPSSLGMALSGGAVGFSTSILNPEAYVGFWTSVAFQMHAGFQFLSLTSGVLFLVARLRNNEVISRIQRVRTEDVPVGYVDQLQDKSRRLLKVVRFMIYAQIVLLFAGSLAFIWLMFLHFQRALYL